MIDPELGVDIVSLGLIYGMRPIPPGDSLTYAFTATYSGAWLYHCGTMPMSLHLANGMFGAVIVDPPDTALPRLRRTTRGLGLRAGPGAQPVAGPWPTGPRRGESPETRPAGRPEEEGNRAGTRGEI